MSEDGWVPPPDLDGLTSRWAAERESLAAHLDASLLVAPTLMRGNALTDIRFTSAESGPLGMASQPVATPMPLVRITVAADLDAPPGRFELFGLGVGWPAVGTYTGLSLIGGHVGFRYNPGETRSWWWFPLPLSNAGDMSPALGWIDASNVAFRGGSSTPLDGGAIVALPPGVTAHLAVPRLGSGAGDNRVMSARRAIADYARRLRRGPV